MNTKCPSTTRTAGSLSSRNRSKKAGIASLTSCDARSAAGALALKTGGIESTCSDAYKRGLRPGSQVSYL